MYLHVCVWVSVMVRRFYSLYIPEVFSASVYLKSYLQVPCKWRSDKQTVSADLVEKQWEEPGQVLIIFSVPFPYSSQVLSLVWIRTVFFFSFVMPALVQGPKRETRGKKGGFGVVVVGGSLEGSTQQKVKACTMSTNLLTVHPTPQIFGPGQSCFQPLSWGDYFPSL